jgi:predicted SAM-dependent methyltransferase
MDLEDLYKVRFDKVALDRKEDLWKVLCGEFFQKYVSETATVVDIGAGYCEFINNIHAAKKIAVDLNPDTANYKNSDVVFIQESCFALNAISQGSVDVFFVSNFLEHLASSEHVIQFLSGLKPLLSDTGKILILQPNIKLVGGAYWDYIDHKIPLTEQSLREAAELAGLQVKEVVKRFLPYTTKTALPTHPEIVRLYLLIRPLWYFFGKQSFLVLEK